MAFISVTRLRVRAWRYLPGFVVAALRAARQAKAAPGIISLAFLRDRGLVFWTRTLWRDEAAMRAFVTAGAHRRTMPLLRLWCDEAAVAHWVEDGPDPPSWSEAHRRLRQDGRRSAVSHPSEAQQAFEIPPPRGSK